LEFRFPYRIDRIALRIAAKDFLLARAPSPTSDEFELRAFVFSDHVCNVGRYRLSLFRR
jgi:hypothetical protein